MVKETPFSFTTALFTTSPRMKQNKAPLRNCFVRFTLWALRYYRSRKMKPHKLFVFIGLLLCGIAKADFIPMPGDDNGHLSVKVIFENPSQKIDSAACWITFMGRHTQLQAGEATYNDTGYYVPVSFEWIRPRTLSFAALHHHEPLPDTLGLILWSKGKRYELSLENRLPIAQQYFYIYADHTELNDYPQKYLWQQWLLYFVNTC